MKPESSIDSSTKADLNNESSRKIVKINIGGKPFKTFETTLAHSRYFVNLLDETLMPNNKKVNTDEVFVDRSGKLFQHILYYLRTNTVVCQDKETIKSLYYEAQFYQIEELVVYFEEFNSSFLPCKKGIQIVDVDKMFGSYEFKDADSQPWYYLIKKTKSSTEKFALIDCINTCLKDPSTSQSGRYTTRIMLLPLSD